MFTVIGATDGDTTEFFVRDPAVREVRQRDQYADTHLTFNCFDGVLPIQSIEHPLHWVIIFDVRCDVVLCRPAVAHCPFHRPRTIFVDDAIVVDVPHIPEFVELLANRFEYLVCELTVLGHAAQSSHFTGRHTQVAIHQFFVLKILIKPLRPAAWSVPAADGHFHSILTFL